MVEYLGDYVFSSRPSVGSIRVCEPYSLSFSSVDFRPSGCSATIFHGCQGYPTVNEMSTASWFTIFSLSFSFLNACLHCEFTLERVVEGRDLQLTAWPMSGFCFDPPRPACRDSFRELFASVMALSSS